jgi:hypothetical protein
VRTSAWIIGACLLGILPAGAAEDDCVWNFQRGRAMAHALTKGYGVYEVVIKQAAPWVTEPDERGKEYGLQHEDLTVAQTGEPLHAGANPQGKAFVLTAFHQPEMTKTSIGPWSAWDGVDAREGGRLVLVYNGGAPGPMLARRQVDGDTALALAVPAGGKLDSLVRVLKHYAQAGQWFERESVRTLLADRRNVEGQAGYLVGLAEDHPGDTAAGPALLAIASETTSEQCALNLLAYLMTASGHGGADFKQKVSDAALTIALRDDPAGKAGLQIILWAAADGDLDAVKGATAEQRAQLILKARRGAPVGLFQQRFDTALKNLEEFAGGAR